MGLFAKDATFMSVQGQNNITLYS